MRATSRDRHPRGSARLVIVCEEVDDGVLGLAAAVDADLCLGWEGGDEGRV